MKLGQLKLGQYEQALLMWWSAANDIWIPGQYSAECYGFASQPK